MQKKYYLVRFTYDYYCQGYEDATETVLVSAPSFAAANNRIIMSNRWLNVRDFVNLTVDLDEVV